MRKQQLKVTGDIIAPHLECLPHIGKIQIGLIIF